MISSEVAPMSYSKLLLQKTSVGNKTPSLYDDKLKDGRECCEPKVFERNTSACYPQQNLSDNGFAQSLERKSKGLSSGTLLVRTSVHTPGIRTTRRTFARRSLASITSSAVHHEPTFRSAFWLIQESFILTRQLWMQCRTATTNSWGLSN